MEICEFDDFVYFVWPACRESGNTDLGKRVYLRLSNFLSHRSFHGDYRSSPSAFPALHCLSCCGWTHWLLEMGSGEGTPGSPISLSRVTSIGRSFFGFHPGCRDL